VRIGTSHKGMILAATSSGKRMLGGMTRVIYLTADKSNSPKFATPSNTQAISKIVYLGDTPAPKGAYATRVTD
jgi:hypothetical protein